jgi:hypothetical protein
MSDPLYFNIVFRQIEVAPKPHTQEKPPSTHPPQIKDGSKKKSLIWIILDLTCIVILNF